MKAYSDHFYTKTAPFIPQNKLSQWIAVSLPVGRKKCYRARSCSAVDVNLSGFHLDAPDFYPLNSSFQAETKKTVFLYAFEMQAFSSVFDGFDCLISRFSQKNHLCKGVGPGFFCNLFCNFSDKCLGSCHWEHSHIHRGLLCKFVALSCYFPFPKTSKFFEPTIMFADHFSGFDWCFVFQFEFAFLVFKDPYFTRLEFFRWVDVLWSSSECFTAECFFRAAMG